jgi:hypothetical protein
MHVPQEDEPDVVLEVPQLHVDEITLEVQDLEARVALDAGVLELLKLHVGVEARLGRVDLTIKGVDAQVLLRARLDNVARIIERVLTTIDENPQIVERLVESAATAADRAGRGVDAVASGLAGHDGAPSPRRRKAPRD